MLLCDAVPGVELICTLSIFRDQWVIRRVLSGLLKPASLIQNLFFFFVVWFYGSVCLIFTLFKAFFFQIMSEIFYLFSAKMLLKLICRTWVMFQNSLSKFIIDKINIGGRCHPKRENLEPRFHVSYTIAINETVREIAWCVRFGLWQAFPYLLAIGSNMSE